MKIILLRTDYTPESTTGLLIVDDKSFCHTLEDTVRARGVKVYGRTAISAGVYPLRLTMSVRFKRVTPEICNVPMFTGVRIHGGNTAEDTEGCILVAKRKVSRTRIQESAEKELNSLLLQDPDDKYIEIIDTYPYGGSNES